MRPLSTRPLCIWVTGAAVPAVERAHGTFAAMIERTTGAAWPGPWSVVDCTTPTAALPSSDAVAGVIVTGSPARIGAQSAWMRTVQDGLRRLVADAVPVLGICFGHQLLAVALGGRAGPNPRGRELGSVCVSWQGTETALGRGPGRFVASATHLDTVLELPPGAQRLASTQLDRHAALRFADRAWGLQFHPEMNGAIIAGYVEALREPAEAEGLDADALLGACRDAPESAALLRAFGRYCADAGTVHG